jgi:hypothetical protein
LLICRFGSPSENQKRNKPKKKENQKNEKKQKEGPQKKEKRKGKRKQNVFVRAAANAAAVRGVRAREREVRDRGARRSRVGL